MKWGAERGVRKKKAKSAVCSRPHAVIPVGSHRLQRRCSSASLGLALMTRCTAPCIGTCWLALGCTFGCLSFQFDRHLLTISPTYPVRYFKIHARFIDVVSRTQTSLTRSDMSRIPKLEWPLCGLIAKLKWSASQTSRRRKAKVVKMMIQMRRRATEVAATYSRRSGRKD